MICINDLIGTWISKDFPMYNYNDNIQVTLHVGGNHIATLWKLENGNSQTFSEGIINIVETENITFQLVIDGVAIDNDFLLIEGKLYIPQEPKSFVLFIPHYGLRYFEKMN